MLKILCQRAAVVASMCAAMLGTSHATTWYLSDITFNDGATVTGWFDYDDFTGLLDSYNLSTTASATFSAFTYVPGNSFIWMPLPGIIGNMGWRSDDSTHYLTLTTSGSLAGASGNVGIRRGGYAVNGSWEYSDSHGLRVVDYLTGVPTITETPIPTVSAVPEVETLGIFVAGLGLIGAVARRRRVLAS